MSDLRAAWAGLMPGHAALGSDLLRRWNEPHRRYHDQGHLSACLDALALLGSTSRTEQLAIWFHDAVHTNTPDLDEARSADLARDLLGTAGLARAEVAEVARLVLLTRDHAPAPGDAAGARVCDADLAELGGPAVRYRVSVAALRAEVGELSEPSWRRVRLARVEQLIADAPLFHTRTGAELWAAAAAANLAAERADLVAAQHA